MAKKKKKLNRKEMEERIRKRKVLDRLIEKPRTAFKRGVVMPSDMRPRKKDFNDSQTTTISG